MGAGGSSSCRGRPGREGPAAASDEQRITLGGGGRRSSASTSRWVPRAFTSWSSASPRALVSPARWKTQSASIAAPSNPCPVATSPVTKRTPASARSPRREAFPTSASTLWPRRTSRRQRWRPMKPLAPVTRTRTDGPPHTSPPSGRAPGGCGEARDLPSFWDGRLSGRPARAPARRRGGDFWGHPGLRGGGALRAVGARVGAVRADLRFAGGGGAAAALAGDAVPAGARVRRRGVDVDGAGGAAGAHAAGAGGGRGLDPPARPRPGALGPARLRRPSVGVGGPRAAGLGDGRVAALLLHVLRLAGGAGDRALPPARPHGVRPLRPGDVHLPHHQLHPLRAGAGGGAALLPGVAVRPAAGRDVRGAVPGVADADAGVPARLLPLRPHRGDGARAGLRLAVRAPRVLAHAPGGGGADRRHRGGAVPLRR